MGGDAGLCAGRGSARDPLRRAVRRRVRDSDVFRRRAGAPPRDRVPDRRRWRRAVCRVPAVRAGARSIHGGRHAWDASARRPRIEMPAGARAREGPAGHAGAWTRSLVRLASNGLPRLPPAPDCAPRSAGFVRADSGNRCSREPGCGRRAAVVSPPALGSAALSPRRHSRQSRSRHDGPLARSALPPARSPGGGARGAAAVMAARQRDLHQAAVQTSRRPVAARRDAGAAQNGLRRSAAPVVRRRADRLGERDHSRSPHARARLDQPPRGRASAPSARNRRAGPREADLVPRVPGIVGAAACRPRRKPRARVRVTMLVRCLAMVRGGGETRHLAWARELTALGVEVEIITGAPLFGEPRYPIEDAQATVLRSPYTRDFVYRFQNRRGFGRLTMTALHVDEEWFCRAAWRRIAASDRQPDIVHAHALHQAARMRVDDMPVVINLPGAPNPRYTADLQEADALIGDGWAAEHLPAALGRRVERVPKGVDAEHFRPDGPNVRDRLGLQRKRVVIAVARLVPLKNLRLLLEAVAVLRDRVPDVHLVIVGEGPEAATLEDHASALALAGRVTFAN